MVTNTMNSVEKHYVRLRYWKNQMIIQLNVPILKLLIFIRNYKSAMI